MKHSLMQAIVAAAVVTASTVSFAQANTPVTRAQVKSELTQLEKSGYALDGSNIDYPANLQAAEARTGAPDSSVVTTTYGGKLAGTTEAGSRAPRSASGHAKSLYLDNANSLYIGD